jgi:16S rRNA (cytosine1402-N4)-methyltransferase
MKAFAARVGSKGQCIGIDADAENLHAARRNLSDFPNIAFFHSNFRHLQNLSLPSPDIVFADLGLSSPHLDDPQRGFSFREEGPLDMRLDRSHGRSAAEFLPSLTENELGTLFARYGELSQGKSFGRFLHHALHGAEKYSLQTTADLKRITERYFTWKTPSVLPQIFQAIRIAVNDELGALESLLSYIPTVLKPGGRFGVISFHSLEDRLVKHTFRALCTPAKDSYTGAVSVPASFELLTKKSISPEEEELTQNPRSRSAKLRVIKKVSA